MLNNPCLRNRFQQEARPLTHDDVSCEELKKHGLEPKDAQHITQAVCNDCDVFLTRDEKSIINPHGQWLETRLRPLKVLEALHAP